MEELKNKIIGEISFCSCFRHIIITIFGKKNKSYTCCGDKPEEYIPKVIDVDDTLLEKLYEIEESYLKGDNGQNYKLETKKGIFKVKFNRAQ